MNAGFDNLMVIGQTISGTGYDERGSFSVTGLPSTDGVLRFTKLYDTGETAEMEIHGTFGSVLMASFTESIQSLGFGFSQAGKLLMKIKTESQMELHAQSLSDDFIFHSCPADVGYGSTNEYFIKWDSLIMLPSATGSGSDTYGSFVAEPTSDTVINQERGDVVLYYKRTYENGHVVYFEDRLPFPLPKGLFEVQSNWSHDRQIDGWAGSGFSRYLLSRTSLGSMQNAFLVTPSPAKGIFAFGDSRLDFYMWNYSNCPVMSGSGLSELGSFTIENSTPTRFTMTYQTCQCHVDYDLEHSGLISIFAVTVNCVNNDGSVGDIIDKTGHMIIRGGVAVDRAKTVNQVSPTWLQATFTRKSELDGSETVRRATSDDFVLFPKISATGSDERGDFQLVAFTVTSIKSQNCFFQVYNDGQVIQYDVFFSVKGPDRLEASGKFVNSNGSSGTVRMVMNWGVEVSNMDEMTEEMKIVMNFGVGMDHLKLKILPQIGGSGVDFHEDYQIEAASMTISKDGELELSYTKAYSSDDSVMTLSGKINYPFEESHQQTWTYDIRGPKLERIMEVFALEASSGTIEIVVSKPTENDYIKENEVNVYTGHNKSYKVSLYPFFRGSGEDWHGTFQIRPEGQSSIIGDQIRVRGTKHYLSGRRKGQKFFFSATLDYPLCSMSGDWTFRNTKNGWTFNKFLPLFKETLGSVLSKPTESYMSVYLGCDQYLVLHSTNLIKLPTVSGTGTSDFGEYTISGNYNIATGDASYSLQFDWGSCMLDVDVTTHSNTEAVGKADLSCTGNVPTGYCDFTGSIIDTPFTESSGDTADDDKVILGENQVVIVMKRNDGKTASGQAVISLFPKFEGHGTDDYKGTYTITSPGLTALDAENTAIFAYDSGVSVEIKYSLQLHADGRFTMRGSFTEQPSNQSGTFVINGEFINMKPLEGWCPVYGSDQPEPWLTSWPHIDGCDYPDDTCPATIQGEFKNVNLF